LREGSFIVSPIKGNAPAPKALNSPFCISHRWRKLYGSREGWPNLKTNIITIPNYRLPQSLYPVRSPDSALSGELDHDGRLKINAKALSHRADPQDFRQADFA
jgi:hypothetical protein